MSRGKKNDRYCLEIDGRRYTCFKVGRDSVGYEFESRQGSRWVLLRRSLVSVAQFQSFMDAIVDAGHTALTLPPEEVCAIIDPPDLTAGCSCSGRAGHNRKGF